MTTEKDFEIFLVAAPGHEEALQAEAAARNFREATAIPGGVTVSGGWPDVWRANLELRGATRIVARLGAFRVMHLAQLDKRARRIPWAEILNPDAPVAVEVTCRKSRIYHSGAAAERIAKAIREELGCPTGAAVTIMARIEDDLCTIGVDTSGELLHKRGHKEAVAKAPMRETMAAMFLAQCGYVGTEPVVDPMCGSGTFVIEAAEIAANLVPGRSRNFAFEKLATFDETAWQQMRQSAAANVIKPQFKFYGSDRDHGAIKMSCANAERAGVTPYTEFNVHAVSELRPPEGPPGLVIVNPPYGSRIGDKKPLFPLYRALGQTLFARFSGWRVGLVTTDTALANATGLPFLPPGPPVSHGGIRIKLYQTRPLP